MPSVVSGRFLLVWPPFPMAVAHEALLLAVSPLTGNIREPLEALPAMELLFELASAIAQSLGPALIQLGILYPIAICRQLVLAAIPPGGLGIPLGTVPIEADGPD